MTDGRPLPYRAQVLFDRMTDDRAGLLDRVAATTELRGELQRFERLLMTDAREDGASWQQIGDALEITRQAAQQRYTATGR